MKKTLFIIIAFLFLCLNAHAATITNVTGTFQDGETVTITGTSLGTGPSVISYQSFDADSLGAGWANSINNNVNPTFSSDQKIAGKSLYCAFPTTNANCYITRSITSSSPKTVYLSYWLYYVYNFSVTPALWQWKMARFYGVSQMSGVTNHSGYGLDQWVCSETGGASSCYDYCYNAYHSNTYAITGSSCSNSPDCIGDDAYPTNYHQSRSCFTEAPTTGEWIKIVMIGQESTINTADGSEIVKVYRSSTGQWSYWHSTIQASDYRKSNLIYPTPQGIITRGDYGSPSNTWNYTHVGGYQGNHGVGTGSADVYMDNMHYQEGTARTMLLCSSASTELNRGRCNELTPVSWSEDGTGGTFTLNTAGFGATDTVYLHFVDEIAGTDVVYGTPITLGDTPASFSVDGVLAGEGCLVDTAHQVVENGNNAQQIYTASPGHVIAVTGCDALTLTTTGGICDFTNVTATKNSICTGTQILAGKPSFSGGGKPSFSVGGKPSIQ